MVFQAEIQAKKISIELPPRVVSRFENTVVGQFYGHTHQDEFIVFYEPEENARATNVAFISPSVATWTNLNPSYRIFTSDSNTHVRHPSFLSSDSSVIQHPIWAFSYISHSYLT